MIHQNKIDVVIFDLGNVVLDWNVDRILESLEIPNPEQDLLREELFSHQDWVEMDRGKKSESTVASEVCERTTLSSGTVEKALLAAKTSLSTIPESTQLMREIHGNGTKMLCLSNLSTETYEHIKNRDFFRLFSGIVISGVEGFMKPDEEIFQILLNRFELEPSNALFIDDSKLNVEAALQLGINGFHFKRSQSCYSEIRSLLL